MMENMIDKQGEDNDRVIEEEEVDYIIPKESTASTVSSVIMLKVPTSRLQILRDEFDRVPDGLSLTQFLQTFIANMELESDNELLAMVPDLIDFFNLVDINGDGNMQWSEFVMFVIEQVVKGETLKIAETMSLVNRHPIQDPGSHLVVHTCRFIKELNKVVIGVGDELHFYETEEKSSTWLNDGFRLKMKKKDEISFLSRKKNKSGKDDKENNKDENKSIEVSDLHFIPSLDVLVVLRTDICIEFLKLVSRSKLSPDSIYNHGFYDLPRSYNKIIFREVKGKITIFGISSNKDIDYWQIVTDTTTGLMTMDYQKQMCYHTDYVRDVMIINTDSFSLFVSGGLDKVVHLWDLESLQHKATRSGFDAGVQCVAFDNKAILLAGSFDFQIIGWDLTAHIDKPLFRLWGHGDCILKIVCLGEFGRCVSLDASGVLNLWDSSKSSATDKNKRLIDSIKYVQDPVDCFDVLVKGQGTFPTLNGIVVVAQGRHQHVYKMTDTSSKPSPPVCVLCASSLLMVITVHAKDIIYWDIVSGEVIKRVTDFSPSEVLSACLDDRERKLIAGLSDGNIMVFNCLNGSKLRTYGPLPHAIRFLIYTPDKTIICVAGAGDVHVFDDLVEDQDIPDAGLREYRGHDADVVSLVFSYNMGLIATSDIKGTIIIWDYQFLSIEIIIKNFGGMDTGQLLFLDPYPFLLICDNRNDFYLIPVGPAAETYLRQYWKVQSIIPSVAPRSANKKLAIFQKDSEKLLKRSSLLMGSLTEDQDEDDDPNNSLKPFTVNSMRRFIKSRNEVKCVTMYYSEIDGFSTTTEAIIKNIDLSAVGSIEESKTVSTDNSETRFELLIVKGHDSGTVSITDLSEAIRSTNVHPITENHIVPNFKNYEPRRIINPRVIRESDILRAAYTEEDMKEGKSYATVEVKTIWNAHGGSVNSLSLVGDKNDIITTGDDQCVNLFTFSGSNKAILTRGSEKDMLYKPRWVNPIDMYAREVERRMLSRQMIQDLNLKRTVNLNKTVYDPFSDTVPKRRVNHDNKKDRISDDNSHSSQNLDSKSLTKYNKAEPARNLVIGQLNGEITYELSSKDYAKIQIQDKQHNALVNELKKNSKKKDKHLTGALYLNDIMKGGEINPDLLYQEEKNKIPFDLKGPRKLKTKFDIEMEIIENSDPINWEIKSSNRQRSLYEKLYQEMDKYKIARNIDKIFAVKLNTLSPNGDFLSFASLIKSKPSTARKIILDNSINSKNNSQDSLHYYEESGEKEKTSPPTLDFQFLNTSDIPKKTQASKEIVNDVNNNSKIKALKTMVKTANISTEKLSKSNTEGNLKPLSPKLTKHGYMSVVDLKNLAEEQNQRKNLLDRFESELNSVEKMYKLSVRKMRKEKRLARSNKPVILDPIDHNNLIFLGSSKTKNHPMRRHTTAKFLLGRQQTMQGLLKLSEKKRIVEEAIDRKFKYTTENIQTKRHKIKKEESLMLKTDVSNATSDDDDSKMFSAAFSNVDYNIEDFDEIDNSDEKFVDTINIDDYVYNLHDKSSINLLKLLNHPIVKLRSKFEQTINELLNFKVITLNMERHEINTSLSEILYNLNPHMSKTERDSSEEFLKHHIVKRRFIQFQIEEEKNKLTPEEKKSLKALFDFFDEDKSGTIDVNELMEVLRKTNENYKKQSVFENEYVEEDALNLDDMKKMIESVDRDDNHVLDFEEFVVLFRHTVRSD